MGANHYTKGITRLDKDTFIVDGVVVKRRYPRREGTVGGVAQAYTIDGKVVGYTLADVRAVVANRNKPKKADDGLDEGPSIQEINALIEQVQPTVATCPCCGSVSKLVTHDYMTYAIECRALSCRVKVERGVVNERGPKECIDIILTAWNRRPGVAAKPLALGKLVEAADGAVQWLTDCHEGTDQWERGQALAKALKPFTK